VDRALLAAALLALIAIATFLLRRRRSRAPASVVPAEVGLDPARGSVGVVGFSTPYCLPCRAWEEALREAGIEFTKVDVSERPELASRYRVSATPLVLVVRLSDGRVLAAFDAGPEDGRLERLAELAGTGRIAHG
jgi:thiol-disulfide isomerase/thioredoxin